MMTEHQIWNNSHISSRYSKYNHSKTSKNNKNISKVPIINTEFPYENELEKYLMKYQNKEILTNSNKNKRSETKISKHFSIKDKILYRNRNQTSFDNKSDQTQSTKSVSPLRPILKNEGYSLKTKKRKDIETTRIKQYPQTNHYHLNIVNNNIYCSSSNNKNNTNILNTFVSKTLQIQSIFRGYDLRRKFFKNINIVFNLHYGFIVLGNHSKNKIIKGNWPKFVKEINKSYKTLNHGVNNFEMFNNNMIHEIDEMLTESYASFIKKKNYSNICSFLTNPNSSSKKNEKNDNKIIAIKLILRTIIYKKKYIVTKMYFRKYMLLVYIDKYFEGHQSNYINLLNQSKRSKLIRIIIIYENKINFFLRTNFCKFLINGLIAQNSTFKKEKEKAEEKLRLQKIMKEKEEERKRILKQYFTIYYHNCVSTQLQEAFKRDKIKKAEELKLKKEKKIWKLIIQKESKYGKRLHNQFMKFYFGGLYRTMVQRSISIADIKKMSSKTLPLHEEIIEKKEEEKTEKPIEDVTKESNNNQIAQELKAKEEIQTQPENTEPKITSAINRKKARELRKLLNHKGRSNKETLKVYFTKFYLAGLFNKIQLSVRRSTIQVSDIAKLNQVIEECSDNDDQDKLSCSNESNKNGPQINPEKVQEIQEKFKKVFYQKERTILLFINSNFKKWNLRAKIIKLKSVTKKPKTKKHSKLKKNKTETVALENNLSKMKVTFELNEDNESNIN